MLSAGIALIRKGRTAPEVLLVHPGGPFWAKKDQAGWSIPKGEVLPGEEPLEAAKREFQEETGLPVSGEPAFLGEWKMPGGKRISAFWAEGDLDVSQVASNTFSMEWPPHSGTQKAFPEIDRAAWFSWSEARGKLHRGLVPLIDLLERHPNVSRMRAQ